MKLGRLSWGAFALVLFYCPVAYSSALDEIKDPNQKASALKGNLVRICENVGRLWPRCSVYQLTDLAPAQAAAVFFDFEQQEKYMPRVDESRLVQKPNLATLHMAYSVKTGIGYDNDRYTVEDKLFTYDEGKSFQIKWKSIGPSEWTQDIEGNIRFERYATEDSRFKTLIVYSNLVTPQDGFLARRGFVQSLYASAMDDIVRAFVNKVKTQPQADFERQKNEFENALAEAEKT